MSHTEVNRVGVAKENEKKNGKKYYYTAGTWAGNGLYRGVACGQIISFRFIFAAKQAHF